MRSIHTTVSAEEHTIMRSSRLQHLLINVFLTMFLQLRFPIFGD